MMPFEHLGTMLDCSRNAVYSVKALKRWIDLTADLGYNTLMLYTEDTYEVDNQPYFGHFRGRYSREELQEIDAYAKERGMELIPCIQTLAHLNALMRWPQYMAIRDTDDILLAEDERTYQLVEDMFRSLAASFTSRLVNIGMDEAHMVGLGRYLDQHGFTDRTQILVRHLARVAEIAARYGFECLMWGDMFFRLATHGEYYAEDVVVTDEIRAMIPDNVRLVYWDYYSQDAKKYSQMMAAHNRIKDGCWFAGGLWTWSGFAPHNYFSLNTVKEAFRGIQEQGTKDVFLTFWGDNGGECSPFAMLPSLFYASELAKGNSRLPAIKAAFKEKYGISFDRYLLLDLPDTFESRQEASHNIYNADKYMLYNDLFMGALDSTAIPGGAEEFARAGRRLARVDAGEFNYLFKAEKALCDVLSIKYDLGLRTRAAYEKKDLEALKALTSDYKKLIDRLEIFYKVYREAWMKDKKPQGFDVQDIRLGGLSRRIRHCLERLEAYLAGEITCIEELDEPALDAMGGGKEFTHKPLQYNSWSGTVSSNVL